ncbi:hypothetical protein KP004_05680 [Geomonas oryzisoli]|uniref:Uncharacterized protein n=1 Tax=Geomonas oryzisoli TaxID=2847992 RepID=A0ABX8J896_9BACT|nr:hypothetical protein [Geomonas oryzisoli]QWV94669.1 hypothetical protein KP004_05680 [Geomonas oryzisoli]
MNAMQKLIAIFILLAGANAYADGYMFKAGRFPEGKVTVLTLTAEQKKQIELYYRCRDNRYTPYIFRLTSEQSKHLKKEAGKSPKRYAIFESYRGEEGIELDYNVINRFSEQSFEIPHKTLVSDSMVQKYENEIMGWKPSPFEKLEIYRLRADKCP